MPSISISKFNFNIIQDHPDFCLPAIVQAMLQYNDGNCKLTQQEILDKIIKTRPDRQPSFGAVSECAEAEFPDFLIKQLVTNDYQEWADNIKKEIDDGFPIATAKRSGLNAVHIRVVLGYDDIMGKFTLFNPGTTFLGQTTSGNQIPYEIISSIDEYSYVEAQSDFKAPNACRDQLTIRFKVPD